MARSRAIAAELAKLFHSAAQPIYVLDDEQTLLFCNKACLDWVGRTAEELHGRRCVYHASPEASGPDAVAAGLCPSPEVLAGRETSGVVASVDAQGRLRRRRARLIPLGGSPQDTVGLIVLVDQDDLPEAEDPGPASGQTEAAWLHEQIRTFRHQAAARFHVDRLVGDCPAMRRVRSQVALAVRSEASVLIVVPGMEGALPSVVGGLVDRPVIAVPTSVGYGASFGGLAALLAMLNSCAAGVTVVNIDNGLGAGVAASLINRA